MQLHYYKYRVTKQVVDTDGSVLGGVSIKAVLPSIMESLTNFLLRNGISPPSLPLTTVYRVEVKGSLYYCKQYTRVQKRNSYTMAYTNPDGQPSYGLIECFIALENKIIAAFHKLSIVSHMIATAPGITHIMPVAIESEMDCCFANDILFKCLFIDTGTETFVAKFPSSIMFD